MTSTRLTWGTFLRLSSISVSAYDYLITIPAEWRIYRSPGSMRFGKISFVLIRYISIILLTVSNIGYFYKGFSAAACSAYYMVSPVLKVTQITVSQVIIGNRTWAITRRSKGLGLFILGFGFIVTALEWYTNLDGRMPVQTAGNCSAGSRRAQWAFYLVAMLFDAVTCVISTSCLVKLAGGINSMSALVKMLFYDGLGYMVVLTVVNILNLILYYLDTVDTVTQLSGASFEYMIIWIMSQQILIHIHEAAEARAQRTFLARQISDPLDTTGAPRYRFNGSTKDGTDSELDVGVRIEQVVAVDYDPGVLGKTTENYGLSRTRDSPRDRPESRSGGDSRA